MMGNQHFKMAFHAAIAGSLLVWAGCGNSAFDTGDPGSLRVIIETIDDQLAPDGYTLDLNEGQEVVSVGLDDEVVFEGLPAGTHTVELEDLGNCEVTNGPNPRSVQVASNQQTTSTLQVACVTPQDQVIAFTRQLGGTWDIWLMEEDGSSPTNLTDNPAVDMRPMTSVDGARIAFMSERAGPPDVWTMLIDGSGLQNVTQNAAVDEQPTWFADGERLAFSSNRDGSFDIWLVDRNGSNLQQITSTAAIDRQPAVSPDGSKIAFVRTENSQTDIWVMNVDGSGQTNLTNGAGENLRPAWFPDGSKIAFSSDRDGGTHDIFVMDADGANPENLTDNPGANDAEPAVSPDGTRIAFSSDRDGTPCGNCDFWDTHSDIWVMDADGSNQTNLTSSPDTHEEDPAWES